MDINLYGQVFRSEKEVLELLYQNPNLDITKINFSDPTTIEKFNAAAKHCDLDCKLSYPKVINSTVDQFDQEHQKNWFFPDEYLKMNIETWLYEQCQTEDQFFRVKEEYELFQKFDMVMILRVAKYLVDTFRNNQVVWGVGRGSSVASYCLFLIGLHKVDSLKYNLDIGEFLK
jgi:DNA polymerase III alpha subunit